MHFSIQIKRKISRYFFSFIKPDPWKIAYTLDGKGVRIMKKEELFEVLGNLEPGMVEKARSDRLPAERSYGKNGRPPQPAR